MQDFVHQQYHNDLHSNVAALFVRHAQIMCFFPFASPYRKKLRGFFFAVFFFFWGGDGYPVC